MTSKTLDADIELLKQMLESAGASIVFVDCTQESDKLNATDVNTVKKEFDGH